MSNFLVAQEKAKKLTSKKITTDVFNFIRSIEKELVAYNQAALFQDSEDVHGNPIGFYSYATELITGGRKAKGQPFDLKETGVFLESIFARVGADSIFFDANDNKKKEVLSHLLSNDIFGLQDDDLNKVINTRVLPFLINYFKKNLV